LNWGERYFRSFLTNEEQVINPGFNINAPVFYPGYSPHSSERVNLTNLRQLLEEERLFDEGFVRGSEMLPQVQWEVEGVH
jgi:hypothetical protein